jgi:hypothetical protein
MHRFNTEEKVVGLSSTPIKKEDVLSTKPKARHNTKPPMKSA